MLHAFKAPTLTDLHERLTERLVNAPKGKLDFTSSVDVQLHNTMSYTPSMEWEFDLKHLWLTPSRWTKMIREYVADVDGATGKPTSEAKALEAWIEKSVKMGTKKRGISVFRTNLVMPKGGVELGQGGKTVRRWGSCMLALSYKAKPQPQITLYSRTSYLGYLSALDLSVAWVAARHIANELNIPIEEFAFMWVNENLQFHYFKSLAYLLNHRDEDKQGYYRYVILAREDEVTEDHGSEKAFLSSLPPALRGSRKWMQKIIGQDDDNVTYGQMTYNTYRRVRRRFHTEIYGYDYALQFESIEERYPESASHARAYKPLPSTLVEDLDMAKIGIQPNWRDE